MGIRGNRGFSALAGCVLAFPSTLVPLRRSFSEQPNQMSAQRGKKKKTLLASSLLVPALDSKMKGHLDYAGGAWLNCCSLPLVAE